MPSFMAAWVEGAVRLSAVRAPAANDFGGLN